MSFRLRIPRSLFSTLYDLPSSPPLRLRSPLQMPLSPGIERYLEPPLFWVSHLSHPPLIEISSDATYLFPSPRLFCVFPFPHTYHLCTPVIFLMITRRNPYLFVRGPCLRPPGFTFLFRRQWVLPVRPAEDFPARLIFFPLSFKPSLSPYPTASIP